MQHTTQNGNKCYWADLSKQELTAQFGGKLLTDCYVNTFFKHIFDAYGELLSFDRN